MLLTKLYPFHELHIAFMNLVLRQFYSELAKDYGSSIQPVTSYWILNAFESSSPLSVVAALVFLALKPSTFSL